MAEKVYQGYTAEELSTQLNVAATVSNLAEIQQENAAESKRVSQQVPCERNVPYGEAELQKLDIFLPETPNGVPVLVDVHGGGWTAGSKNARSFPAEAIVPHGVMWVPIDYGLAPDYPMNTIVDHVRQAIAWIYANIANYGGDPDRIYVSGNSAGGHLTACTVMPGWQTEHDVPEDVVKGACCMSGIYDLDALRLAAQGPNTQLKLSAEEARRNSPLSALPDYGPPMIVAYGEPELKEFKRQGAEYAATLKQAGLPVFEIVVPDAHHFAMSRELADPDSELHQAIMGMMNVGPHENDWRRHFGWG